MVTPSPRAQSSSSAAPKHCRLSFGCAGALQLWLLPQLLPRLCPAYDALRAGYPTSTHRRRPNRSKSIRQVWRRNANLSSTAPDSLRHTNRADAPRDSRTCFRDDDGSNRRSPCSYAACTGTPFVAPSAQAPRVERRSLEICKLPVPSPDLLVLRLRPRQRVPVQLRLQPREEPFQTPGEQRGHGP